MSSAQDRLVVFALLIAESAWIFAFIGVLGLMLGGDGSPLDWLAVLAVLTTSMFVARFLQALLMPTIMAYAFQMLAGIFVIYLTIGSQVHPTFQGIDLSWLVNLNSEFSPEGYKIRAVLGSLLSAAVWWRGGQVGAAAFPTESLTTSFKIGMIVMALAAVVDVAHPADLNIFPVMFIFFAAGLIGLSIGHILPSSSKQWERKAWTRVIGVVVLAIVVMGLLFSLLQRNALSIITTPVFFVLNILATVVFFVIIIPIAYIVDILTRLLFRLFANFAPENVENQLLNPGDSLSEQLRALQEGRPEQPVASLLLQIGQWALVAIIIFAALYILARAYKRKERDREVVDESTRESVMEEADVAYDLAKLLFNFLPGRLRRRRPHKDYRLPDDERSIVDVFRIYFGLLTLAEKKGRRKPSHATPSEYQSTLEELFPRDLVRDSTHAFVQACYGHHPASREQIEDMRTSLERAASGKSPKEA